MKNPKNMTYKELSTEVAVIRCEMRKATNE